MLKPRSQWVAKSTRSCCVGCKSRFWVFLLKHHCRVCGDIFCRTCTSHKVGSTFERACSPCKTAWEEVAALDAVRFWNRVQTVAAQKAHKKLQKSHAAIRWYRMAADAQNSPAICYQNGKGVAKGLKEAVTWIQKAADQGHAEAQYNLGFCYYNGKGVVKDHKESVRWYQKAADQGHTEAQNNLGFCYYN
eukprot:CAMPEP_0114502614 /NCGR_PEP_ID=MMETSP0109-20121206/9193_1 /TAXON_ID=29199 /ORGANISM="Chlorarachnion reptans, Strain CCCM449" /LENGTH=189 /DNA_ID=CAMNT_0001680557 /DNA_START=269 /DNA_END=835 /DNA_ORIENTATION=+